MSRPQRTPITYVDQQLIDNLILSGYGYAKFARSVSNQGWCSPKQRQTMQNMNQRIAADRARYPSRRRSRKRGSYTNYDWDEMHEMGYEGHPGQYDGEGFW